jgi:hypothetical protein
VLSRLVLAALADCGEKESALQERMAFLRGKSDEALARLFQVPRRAKDDDAVCPWHGAIASLRTIDLVALPSKQLEALLQVKNQVYRDATEWLGLKAISADDFLPVLTFVIVRAGLKHPWTTARLLRQLMGGDDYVVGEQAYFFISFEIALGHILDMPLDLHER